MRTETPLGEIGDEDVLRLNRRVLDTRTAQALCDELAQSGRLTLCVDFLRVEFVTPGGLAKLLDLHAQLRAAGGCLRLCNAEGCLELTRLCGVPDAHRLAAPHSPV
jgi:anti-anti-sigma regulatory factor